MHAYIYIYTYLCVYIYIHIYTYYTYSQFMAQMTNQPNATDPMINDPQTWSTWCRHS